VRTKRERRVYYAYDDADEINAVSLSLRKYQVLQITYSSHCLFYSISFSLENVAR
jgi:hypothetical protein